MEILQTVCNEYGITIDRYTSLYHRAQMVYPERVEKLNKQVRRGLILHDEFYSRVISIGASVVCGVTEDVQA